MRIFFILIITSLLSCNQGNKSNNSKGTGLDGCSKFNNTLNGVFSSELAEGTMTWQGGTEGTVEIEGLDYNDIVCQFQILDCSSGSIAMICQGAEYNTQITVLDKDSYELDDIKYTKVK